MADKTLGGPAHGTPMSGDQTALPGQAAGKIPFGIKNPLSTGAPGTAGVGMTPSDPTLTAPVPTSIYGASTDDTATGAPGGNGFHDTVATGATYTLDTYGWVTQINMTGGSVDTEAQANKYGSDTGVPGLHTPKTTGAPGSGGGGSVTDGSERIH
jgi:hypothetical protein